MSEFDEREMVMTPANIVAGAVNVVLVLLLIIAAAVAVARVIAWAM